MPTVFVGAEFSGRGFCCVCLMEAEGKAGAVTSSKLRFSQKQKNCDINVAFFKNGEIDVVEHPNIT